MRNLAINLEPVYYKNYEGEEEIILPGDISTGVYTPKYSELKRAMLCVSPSIGTSETYMFGSFEDYDKTMTTAEKDLDIGEDSVLWIGGVDTNGPWNYIVKRVGKWKNSISYAVKQVSISMYQEQMQKEKDAQKFLKGMRV